MQLLSHRLAHASLIVILTGLALSLQAEPNILLFGATLDEARTLAVDSATLKGWNVINLDDSGATFEQVLEEEDTWEGWPILLIRVRAELVQEASGVRVLLYADEVEQPYSAEEWVYDVTDDYAENLDHALSKLRARWDAGQHGWQVDTTPTGPPPAPVPNYGYADGTRMSSNEDTSDAEVGTWAYYAERYAQSRGCDLEEQGAILEAAGQDWEQHRVRCLNGGEMRIFCRDGDCTSAR